MHDCPARPAAAVVCRLDISTESERMAYDLLDAVVGWLDPPPARPSTFVFIGDEPAIAWPEAWPRPSKAYLAAAVEASKRYDVPIENIFAITRKESHRFSPTVKGRQLAASYNRVKDMVIPGSGGVTWGERFAPEEWRAYGIMQVLPYNLIGVPGLLKWNAPKEQMLDTRLNVLAGARVLRQWHDKLGNWEDAIWKYNGARSYQREVLAFREEYRAAQAVA